MPEQAPAASAPPASAPRAVEASPPRRVIAVLGLGARCGATTVARALAAELAGRDAAGAATVSSKARAGGIPLATPAASRLARSLVDVPRARTTAVGRLCLVEGADPRALRDTAPFFAPLVLDAGGSAIGRRPRVGGGRGRARHGSAGPARPGPLAVDCMHVTEASRSSP